MATYTEWGEALEKELAAPFPPDVVLEKTMGGRKISFVPWWRYVERLNELVGGGWSMGDPVIQHIGEKLVMGIPVTIFGVTRINFGDEDDDEFEEVVNKETGEVEEKKTMYGSPVTNAFAQAFKRTMAMFGMGLTMYDKSKRGARPQQRQARPASPPQQPKTPAVEALKARCKSKLDAAAAAQAITVEESARVEGAISSGDQGRIENAITWLDGRLDAARLGG